MFQSELIITSFLIVNGEEKGVDLNWDFRCEDETNCTVADFMLLCWQYSEHKPILIYVDDQF